MQDLVSIISPCYNGERYLVPFLDSVFAQTYSLIELILVDDASVDHTQDIVKSYIPLFQSRGYTLTYLRQEENKGQAAAINTGLKFVSGEYLSWMDSDDILYPEAIEKKICFLKKNMELDFVLCSGEVVSEKDLEKPLGYLKRIKPKGKDDVKHKTGGKYRSSDQRIPFSTEEFADGVIGTRPKYRHRIHQHMKGHK